MREDAAIIPFPMSLSRFFSLVSLLTLLTFPPVCSGQEIQPWGISSEEIPVVTEGTFAVGTELSGIASLDGVGCLVVSNETRCAEIGYLKSTPWRFTAGPEIPLVPPAGGPEECDFEAVAADPVSATFYVLGSHAVAKKKGKPRVEQQVLFRLPADATTKLPDPAKGPEYQGISLTPWLLRVPEIAQYFGKPLQQNGLNLEGLGYRNGNLFIGCRAPHLQGRTPVLEIAANDLFTRPPGQWPAPKVHLLPLGQGCGVRDLAPVKDGFLILVGESGSEASEAYPRTENYLKDENFTLYFWNPSDTRPPARVGNLPIVLGKAESLLVYEETDQMITVIVLYDGSYNGMPRVFKLSKPKRD
jgi:hypothetical protein